MSVHAEQDTDLVRLARAVGNSVSGSDVVALDAAGTFSRVAWQELADAGFMGLPVPSAYRGKGVGAQDTVAALAALGETCTDNGVLFALGAHLWACVDPIVAFGTEPQKRRWLPGLAQGSLIGAHAASEPGAGSDATAIHTTATRTADGWVLDGLKTFVTNAPVADLFLVTAITDAARGPLGLSVFLVEQGAPGLMLGRTIEKCGLRTASMAEIALTGCRVGAEALLGAEGAGLAIFHATMTRERAFILAPVVGVLRRLADQCADYTARRRQFGQPISEFQSVSNRLADMRVRERTSRLLTHWAAEQVDRGQAQPEHAAMVKLHLAESFLASALDAVHMHGGNGYTTTMELERMVRDAMGAGLYSGTSDIQRNLIARASFRRADTRASERS